MKTYHRHNCTSKHRTLQTLTRCMFRRAEWIQGDGPYACLAWCSVLTITLHPTFDDAYHAKDHIDDHACGHACTNHHEIVVIDLERQIGK